MESLDLTLFGLAIFLFAGWCFNWFLHVLAILYGKWKLHRPTPAVPPEDLPGISVLKPLVGVDPHLFENLESFFTLKYPAFELLFCIQDEMDGALMVVKSLCQKYPNVDAKLFLGGKKVGVNPKINNMSIGYEAAKYDLIMISDSGLKMAPDTLLDMALTLTDKVGLVHQMPYACSRKGIASHLEKVYFGSQHAKMYLCADVFRINCTTGMSCLMRKHVVEEAGGLKEFGHYLAEDYFLGQAFLDRGWRVKISSHTAMQNSGMYSISQHHNRLVRWMKLRTAMLPLTMFLEPVSQCMVMGALVSWAVTYLFDWSPLMFFLGHVLVWFLLDYLQIKVIENKPLPFSKFEYIVCWFLNELSYLALIVQSHIDSTISWRGKRFRLRWGGYVEEMHTKQTV
ncbi:hypothetical protein ACJMK2_040682 [Sinanodonta woodiana]|uniref:ceramide glucosyltransferase n=1 Tax=Sinanodonta woodiana TaxID=1069815 RepID=A0ABD3W353_SINWO